MFTRHLGTLALITAVMVTAQPALPAAATRAPSICTVAAAGDVAGSDDWRTGAASTAALITRTRPQRVLALGDLAYNAGTKAEFANYYEPTWGRFKDITKPTPGNHEYYTASLGSAGHDATAYFNYFRVAPQYSFDVCGWHIVSLNSEIGSAAQADFLRRDVAQNRGKPLLVFWHQPRFSSGQHGSSANQQTLWAAANQAGAAVVLSGHDHHYERFARMNAAGQRRSDGVRLFIAGTGGHHPRKVKNHRERNSRAVVERVGVLYLDLHRRSYTWRFVTTDGRIQDQGSSSL